MSDSVTIKELIIRVEKEIDEKITKLESSIDQLWEKIDKIQNRPPVWVTIVISILMGVIGFLSKG